MTKLRFSGLYDQAAHCGKLLHMAANEKMLTMYFHFDFPGLGYVKENEEAWVWEPIKTKNNNAQKP